MSQRTVIEINHDLAHRFHDRPDLVELIVRALSSGSERDWEPLRSYGIRRIVQLHHTDERKVVTRFAEYPFW